MSIIPRYITALYVLCSILTSLRGNALATVTETVVAVPIVTHTVVAEPITKHAAVITTTTTSTITTCISIFERSSRDIAKRRPATAEVVGPADRLGEATTTITVVDRKAAIKTTTTTVTPTVTATSRPTASPQTQTVTATTTAYYPNPQGFQWAYQKNINGPNRNSLYPDWKPVDYQNATALFNGTIPDLMYIDDDCATTNTAIYNNYVPCNYFVLNHRAYLYIPTTGTYTFNFEYRDDVVGVWLNDRAYNGYTRRNALVTETYPGNSNPSSFTISLVGDQYLPIRVLFGQAEYGYSFSLSVVDPDGNYVIGGESPSGNVVQYSCNPDDNAPAFPPYGEEES